MRLRKKNRKYKKKIITSDKINEAQRLAECWAKAEQGEIGAQNYLGTLYEKGVEVLKNYEEAFRWYQKSANLGDTYAQIKLSEFYNKGLGVDPDKIQAYKWLNIATKKGIRGIGEQRDSLEKTMTADQINKAQRLAKGWTEGSEVSENLEKLVEGAKEKRSSSHKPRKTELVPSRTGKVTPPIQLENWNPSGSGFYLKGTSHILTNLHVVGTASKIYVSFPSGEKYSGKIIARDANNDVAIIELEGMSPRDSGFHVSLDVEFDPGMEVHAIGFPLNSGIGIVSGKVISSTGINQNVAKFTMTTPINEGNSGGPVIDENGNLIGIAQGGLVQGGRRKCPVRDKNIDNHSHTRNCKTHTSIQHSGDRKESEVQFTGNF